MNKKEDDLTVITRAKELCSYIMTITDKSPKKFRFTLVTRIQNYSLDVIENLYLANSVLLMKSITEEEQRIRRMHQQEAMTRLRLLAYMCMIARENQCILPDQQRIIGDKIVETQRLLYAWEQSDKNRLEAAGIITHK